MDWPERRMEAATVFSDTSAPTCDSTEVSSTVTMNVAAATRSSPRAARWPRKTAVVMPPAQAAATFRRALPAVRRARLT